MVIIMTNLNNVLFDLSVEEKAILDTEEKWVFDMNEEEFEHMTMHCELPVYEAARKGMYEHYENYVPTKEWMDAFHMSYGIESRVLFAMLHNALFRTAYNYRLKPEYQKAESPFSFVAHPYQGFSNKAEFCGF